MVVGNEVVDVVGSIDVVVEDEVDDVVGSIDDVVDDVVGKFPLQIVDISPEVSWGVIFVLVTVAVID